MTVAQRVFRHTVIQIASRGVGSLLGLVAIGIMTRALGTAGFGAYTSVTAYLGTAAVLVDFGISTTLVAMLSEKGADEDRLARNALGVRLASTAALMAVAASVAAFLPYPPAVRGGIALLAVSYVAVAVQQVQTAIFQRHVAMHLPAIAEVAGRAILVGGIWAAARAGAGLEGVLVAIIAANVGQALLAHALLRGIAPLAPAFEPATWRRILLRAWPVGLSIMFNLIYLRADTVILSFTRPLEEVGVYGAAYRVVDVLTVFPMLFMGIVLPFLSRAWSEGDRARFARVLGRATDALALAAAPLAAGALALGPDLLALVAGEEFRGSGEVLRLLVFGVAAIYVAAAFTHAVVAAGAQRRMLPLLAGDAAVSLVLYAFLIPRYGMWAAAWITVLSEILAVLAAIVVALGASGARLSLAVPVRAALAATGMAALDGLFRGLPVVPRGMADALVYACLAVLFGAVTPATIREFLAVRRTAA